MLGVVPRELWQREHPADTQNRIRLNLTCPLIIKGKQAILVDTGIGNRLSAVERKIFDHQEGWLPEGLAASGMEPGDITHILLSHLHFDHCGGIVRRRASGKLEAAFPRAQVFVQQGELEIATKTKNERLRAAYRHLHECLEPVRPAIVGLKGDTELIDGVSADGYRWPYDRPSGGGGAFREPRLSSIWRISCRRDHICAGHGIRPTTWMR